ncbi:glycoside hydrolase family 5 protein [Blastomonas sp.]|uniref:glycoside hydrolase family 5 protein n=1 Tax=Blastomonas sp. TaxID=1909299 RepID=UPI0039189663
MPDPFNRRTLLAGLGAAGAAVAVGQGGAGWALQRVSAAMNSGPPTLPARMRGLNLELSPGSLVPGIARELAGWGVNTVRVNFSTDLAAGTAPDKRIVRPGRTDPLAPYRTNLAMLKAFTAECAALGVGVMLSASGIYGRDTVNLDDSSGASFRAGVGNSLMQFWPAIARELRDDPAIFAYDVFNEPNYTFRREADGAVWYEQLMPEAIRRIRAVNKSIWLAVMPWPWGFASRYTSMPLIDDPAILYTFHNYTPHNYTHQGLGTAPRGVRYPGDISEYDTEAPRRWDRAALAASMQPAFDFARRHGVRMMASEFGVTRWAPGRDRWVADMLSIFEENNADWLFHTYNTWNGWNPSFRPDAEEVGVYPTLYGGYNSPTHQLLRRHWRLNAG